MNELFEYIKKEKIVLDDKAKDKIIRSLIKIEVDGKVDRSAIDQPHGKQYYTSYDMYHMEKYVEYFCEGIMKNKFKLPKGYTKENLIEMTQLDSAQQTAVDRIIRYPISVVTGPRGQ